MHSSSGKTDTELGESCNIPVTKMRYDVSVIEPGGIMELNRHYNAKAAEAAWLYLASQLPSADVHRIFKLLYLADKLHLEKWGRQLAGFTYLKLYYGPVPTKLFELYNAAQERPGFISTDGMFQVERKVMGNSRKPIPFIRPLQEPDLEELSRSDIECLDEVIAVYGSRTFDELTNLTHDAAYHASNLYELIPLEEIVRTLPDAEDLLQHLENPYP
jgi:Protein of unknown function (DUF4065)